MSLPWAARGLKIPYLVRSDWQIRGLAMAGALTCYQPLTVEVVSLGGSRICFGYQFGQLVQALPDHWDLIALDSSAADCSRRVSLRCRPRDWLWWAYSLRDAAS